MPEGYIHIEVEADRIERLSFRRADKPGALIAVTIGNETINVEPQALLLALKTITEE